MTAYGSSKVKNIHTNPRNGERTAEMESLHN